MWKKLSLCLLHQGRGYQNLRRPLRTLNENAVEQVASTKSLGVSINQNWNWECLNENVPHKIAGEIKRIRHFTLFNILIQVYSSLIWPHFDYCNDLWWNCNKGLYGKLCGLQNRLARSLMSASYGSNLADLFRALWWRILIKRLIKDQNRNLSWCTGGGFLSLALPAFLPFAILSLFT